MTDKDNAG